MSELGDKARAGRMLSEALRQIAQEKTEVFTDEDGDSRMVTKAEALARLKWKQALGYTEEITVEQPDGTRAIKTTIHAPDNAAALLILDRIEGKVSQIDVDEKKRPTAAQKVSELSKNRINALSKDVPAE